MTQVLIVDDQPLVRRGLREILAEDPTISAVGEAATAAEALALAREQAWDIIVLDISLPDESGVSVLRQLRAEQPALRIIMFSFHTAEAVVRACLRAGAAGYLTKEAGPDQLLDAIQTVLAGRLFVSPAVAAALDDTGDLNPPDEGDAA
jgi:two-component system invasion response regulator UvrY